MTTKNELNERVTKLESRVSNMVGTYAHRGEISSVERIVEYNEKRLEQLDKRASIWMIVLTSAIVGLIGWNVALTNHLDDINARTVAHQVLPK